jgi:hypothetical protein
MERSMAEAGVHDLLGYVLWSLGNARMHSDEWLTIYYHHNYKD